MIKKLHIGETVTLPQHPFSVNTELKIGGNAIYTSPILNVADVLIGKGFDTATDELVPRKKNSQALCYYYSNKLGTFEKHWISFGELCNIKEPHLDNSHQKIVNGKLTNDFKDSDEVIGLPKQELNIETIKNKFLDKTVILKSADLEINKQKFHIQQLLEDKNKYSIEHYHEFLSPMMTVIDIVDNKNFNNDRLDEKGGSIKRLPSKYFLKCKWFNPVKQTFSEELLPPIIVDEVLIPANIDLLIAAINNKNIFRLIKDNEKRFVYINKVVQIHHTYRVVFWDILKQRNDSENINELLQIENIGFELKDLLEDAVEIEDVEDIVVAKDEYYQIKYLDKANRFTTRIIKCTGSNEKTVFAVCTLRNNDERIFRKDGILMLRHVKKTFKDLLKE